MKEIIYLKIEISEENEELEKIRNEGLFFDSIAQALWLNRDEIIEIDETNFKDVCNELKRRFND